MKFTLGRKRRFVLCGLANALATNLVLQVSLLFLATGVATLIAQFCNMTLGFFLYGKKVFQVARLQNRFAVRYFLSSVVLWFCNWAGIACLASFGLPRNFAAVALIPFLAALSYSLQKLVVFRSDSLNSVFK